MRTLCILLLLAAMRGTLPPANAMTEDSMTVMFWNLENFYDFRDDGTGESDAEFSATGARRWTKGRFYRKCQAVAKTILWAGSAAVNDGRGIGLATGGDGGGVEAGAVPDIVGVAEVENRFVLTQVVSKTALRKLDYEIVHFDSPDPRGIDCALMYRASRLTLVSAKPCRVGTHGKEDATDEDRGAELRTRDILLAQFVTAAGDSLAVLVNHHPSKYGGGETDWRREVAVARLRALGDSLAAAGWVRAIAIGDFNDTPDNPLFSRLSPAFSLCRQKEVPFSGWDAAGSRLLVPLAGGADPFRENVRPAASHPEKDGEKPAKGSIRFNGEWQLIDLCFVSPALKDAASFSVLEPSFLTERDAAHSGDRPLRTYSGPRYLGGVSDHRPILVRIKLYSQRHR